MKARPDSVKRAGKQAGKRAATYIPFATVQIGQTLQAAVEDDVAKARGWAESQGIELKQTFSDGPDSGRSAPNKPGFKAMVQAAERGDFDILIVRDLARITRNSVAASFWVQELETLGIAIWQMDAARIVDQSDIIRLMMTEQQTASHGRLVREGIAVAKSRPKKNSLDVALDKLAAIAHPPGWDVVANVRFSAAYKYDHSLELKTFVVYGRDETNAHDGAALEDGDIRRCLKLGQHQGWRCVGTYADLGVSRTEAAGPALEKLLDRIRKDDIDYVIVGDLSQLSCDASTIAELTKAFGAAGVELAVAHDQGERS